MKTKFTRVSIALFSIFFSKFNAQNIITVDNNVNATANFSNLQDAINSAASNDVIYIYPSATSYGNATINKKLHLKGIGHTPEVTNGIAATLGSVTYTSNSGISNSTGSTISGLVIGNIQVSGTPSPNNIVIQNNIINSGISTNASSNNDNFIVQGNVIKNGPAISLNNTCDNWQIINNFIQEQSGNFMFSNLSADTILSNNIIVWNPNTPSLNLFSSSFNIASNNIFLAKGSNTVNFAMNSSNVVFRNNITYNYSGASFATLSGTGNFNNTNPSFATIPNPIGDYSVANDYHLTNTTLLGTDGTEIGIFGLGFPFNKRGYSFLMPYIEKMEILNTAIPVNGTLKVDITAKSN